MRSRIDHPPWLLEVAPVCDETSMLDLEVRGELPAQLSGQYVRIGPNALGSRPGCGGLRAPMVHAVTLAGGRALGYRNRWVVTDSTAAVLAAETVPGPEDPDGCLTTITHADGTLLATGPGPVAYELAPDLTTTRKRAIGDLPETARAERDRTGWHLSGGRARRLRPHTGTTETYQGTGWLGDLVEVRVPGSLELLLGTCHRHDEAAVRLSVWAIGSPGEPVAEVVIPRQLPPAAHTTWAPQTAPGRSAPTGTPTR